MTKKIENTSYYSEKLPSLIDKLKSMVDKNLDIIDQDIIADVSEDKYYNVLKGRKMAAEDCVWALRRIDELESELRGEDNTVKPKQSWAKRAANKK